MIVQYIVLSGPWEDLREEAEQSLSTGQWVKWIGTTPQEALERCAWKPYHNTDHRLKLWLCLNHKLAWPIPMEGSAMVRPSLEN